MIYGGRYFTIKFCFQIGESARRYYWIEDPVTGETAFVWEYVSPIRDF